MSIRLLGLALITVILPITIQAIGIPLHQGPRCMVIQGQFDPIKLQVKFPKIPNKQPQQKFKLVLYDFVSDETLFDVLLEEQTIYRKNLQLPYNKLFHLCMYAWTSRNSFNQVTQSMYAEYIAHQDFDSLIGTIQVPPELMGEKNLQYIYTKSQSINQVSKKIIENQKRERQIEDSMATSNLHKNQRISMFTIIECVIIVLSGIYQVMALRRFLIEKNMY